MLTSAACIIVAGINDDYVLTLWLLRHADIGYNLYVRRSLRHKDETQVFDKKIKTYLGGYLSLDEVIGECEYLTASLRKWHYQ